MNYYQIDNPGVAGFVTHEENEAAHVSNPIGNIWATDNTAWALRVGATQVTQEEAQAAANAIIDAAIAAWDETSDQPRPEYITL